jgi:predicted dienelactone hydrolase
VVARPAGLTRRGALIGLAALAGCAGTGPTPSIRTADAQLVTADGRAVLYRVAWPAAGSGPLGLVLLSHGANGSLDGLDALIRAFAAERIVAAPLHPDGEGHPLHGKVALRDQLPMRVADMRLLLDSLPAIEKLAGRRIDPQRIAAAGHSFGALIAQILGGAQAGAPGEPMRGWRDPRVRAVLAFSPPGPVPGYFGAEGWSKIAAPMLVQTGTADVLPMIAPKWEAHLASYEASAVPGSVLWVGQGVDHYFGNLIQRPAREAPDQSAAFAAAVAVAQAFLDARLDGDAAARRWLAGGGPAKRFAAETARYETR